MTKVEDPIRMKMFENLRNRHSKAKRISEIVMNQTNSLHQGIKTMKQTNITLHSGPKNLKKSRPKKLVISNNSISRKFFWPNFIFGHFRNFSTGKRFKTAKNAISQRKKIIYLISRVFCLNFLKIFLPSVHS